MPAQANAVATMIARRALSGGAEPPAFEGPFDDYNSNALGWWSVLGRMLTAYTGALIEARKGASTVQDIGYGDDGFIDQTALLAFAAGGDVFVSKVYDQSGLGNHLVQATTSKQPAIVLSGVVQKVNLAVKCTGAGSQLNASQTLTGAFTLYGTTRKRDASDASLGGILTVGNFVHVSASPGLSIFDGFDYDGAPWECCDSIGNPYAIGSTNVNTWSVKVIASAGTDGTNTKFRSDSDEQVQTVGVALNSPVKFGDGTTATTTMEMEFAEGALFSVAHVSGTMTALQSLFRSRIAPALAALMIAAVDSSIAGQNPATALDVYSTQDHATATYVRNTGCFGADFDLTCISPWNSLTENRFNAILVHPRIAMFATHPGAPLAGDTVRFIQADGTVVTRTIQTPMAVVTDTASQFPDIKLGLLDSDVPAGISYARVLPVDFRRYLYLSGYDHIPCLAVNQDQELLVFDIDSLPAVTTASQRMEWGSPAFGSLRRDFWKTLVSGDSGTPLFTMIDGKVVLLAQATSGLSGTHKAPWHTAINSAMSGLLGGAALTDIDLSSYGTY